MKKKKLCVVTTRNLFDSPCLKKYCAILGDDFDIIYWDRCGIEESCGTGIHYKFSGLLDVNASKIKKLQEYIRFTYFARKILRKHTYDGLIVYPTQAGWLIHGPLIGKYREKYIYDIQDYAGENARLPAWYTSNIIKNSALVSITSSAYRKFLPEFDYLISHNVQAMDSKLTENYRKKEYDDTKPIQISFIGSVRFIQQQIAIIDCFKNDSRFHLNYIGRGSEQLEYFCIENNVQNVTLIGQFEPSALSEFYVNTDFAMNIYGNCNPYLDYALSNKLYSAAMMGMPVLVSPGTYMEEIVTKYGFGLAIDISQSSCKEAVFQYYQSMHKEKILSGCDSFLAAVREDEKVYSDAILQFQMTPE